MVQPAAIAPTAATGPTDTGGPTAAIAPTAASEPTTATGIDRVAVRHDRIDRLARLLHTIDLESEAAWAVVDRLVDEAESFWADPWTTSRTRLDEARRAELGYD